MFYRTRVANKRDIILLLIQYSHTHNLQRNAAASESDGEEASETHVELPENFPGHAHSAAAQKSAQSAVRLQELGPRITMKLHKIQDGFAEGEVIFHAHVRKTEDEVEQLKKRKELEKAEKKKRQEEQDRNYKRKRGINEDGQDEEEQGEDEDERGQGDGAAEEAQSDNEEDDDEYYRLEVGEEPPTGARPSLGGRGRGKRGRGSSSWRGRGRGGGGRGGGRGGFKRGRGSSRGRGRGRGRGSS